MQYVLKRVELYVFSPLSTKHLLAFFLLSVSTFLYDDNYNLMQLNDKEHIFDNFSLSVLYYPYIFIKLYVYIFWKKCPYLSLYFAETLR